MTRLRWTMIILFLAAASASARAQGSEVILFENFDGVEAPNIPSGWLATPSAWETNSSSASSGSGGNNAMSRGSIAGELRMPPLNLAGASSASVGFLARRTSSYDRLNLSLTASVNGGASFDIVIVAAGSAVPEATSTYQMIEADVPSALLGQSAVIFRFESFGISSSTANARIDDVKITVERPVLVSPGHIKFTAAPGEVVSNSVVATNYSGESLTLGPPVISSGAYAVEPAASITLADGSSQEYVVSFAPLTDGEFPGTLTIVHPYGSNVVDLDGSTRGGRFGFSAPSSTLVDGAVTDVTLALDFANTVGIQGIQFEISWEDPALDVVGFERGEAIDDATTWTFSYESSNQKVRAVLLGSGAESLPPGRYDELVSLQFTLSDEQEAVADSVRLMLSQVIGSLAVADGSDANLVAEPHHHTIYLGERDAFFVVDNHEVALPDVLVGDSISAAVRVSNPGGTTPLVIRDVTSENGLFRITPDSAVVAGDSTVLFDVTFSPTMLLFGEQRGAIRFEHNAGPNGLDSILVMGRGVGGRGDADADGYVDAVDVVQVVDFVLERGTPEDGQVNSADLYPFAEGDGMLDVRDLTVLSHAVVNASWPDGVPLPAMPQSGGSGSLLIAAEMLQERFDLTSTWNIRLATDVPVRALQVVLDVSDVASVTAIAPEGGETAPITLFTYDDKFVRIISYRMDGEAMEPGQYELLKIEPRDGGGTVRPLFVIGVDEGMKRVPVAILGPEVEGEDNEVPGSAISLGSAFPNPVRFAAGERLRVPLVGRTSGGRSRPAVYNVLGQRVRRLDAAVDGETVLEWDGRDQRGGLASPGIYFIRLEGGEGGTRAVVVVP